MDRNVWFSGQVSVNSSQWSKGFLRWGWPWFKKLVEDFRRGMVSQVRGAKALRAVAKASGVSLHTVQVWVARAGDVRLDQVDCPRGGRRPEQVTTPFGRSLNGDESLFVRFVVS